MFKPGDIIYEFTLKIDFAENKTTIECKESKVLDSNDKIFVLKNSNYDRIQYKSDRVHNSHEVFKKVYVYESKYLPYWDYVQGSFYTQFPSKKIALKRLKKEVGNWLHEKHGRYCRGIELLDAI